MRPRRILFVLIPLLSQAVRTVAHDIPDARVDRSIQLTLRPALLEIDYEVSLSELTVAQDLRALIGPLPGGTRGTLHERYGRETGTLNAKGFLVTVDGRQVDVQVRHVGHVVEEHPRFTYHLIAPLPPSGRLVVRDTNFSGSEGTSRLAFRVLSGVTARGYDGPAEVDAVPIRPVWQLSDVEERRTKELSVVYSSAASPNRPASAASKPVAERSSDRVDNSLSKRSPRLTRLLDSATAVSWPVLWMTSVLLGAAHAVQPGHGKALVAAAAVGERGGAWAGVLLALVTALVHTAGVLGLALALWIAPTRDYAPWNQALTGLAGFAIAAVGLWRLGHSWSGAPGHSHPHDPAIGRRGILGLGLAGGLVPCWDAIVLVLLAASIGRLGRGILLLSGFSAGMAGVLVAVGLLSGKLRGIAQRTDPSGNWTIRLGRFSSLVLTTIGVYLLMG